MGESRVRFLFGLIARVAVGLAHIGRADEIVNFTNRLRKLLGTVEQVFGQGQQAFEIGIGLQPCAL